MKLHIPGLPPIVQRAFDTLLNRGIGRDNLSNDVLAGMIVESGSNANGEYVRWGNGLQVCMAKVEVDFTSTGFKNFPYPAEFFDNPWGGSFAAGSGVFSAIDDPRKFTMSTLRLGTNAWEFRVNEVFSETNRQTLFFAIGRWK